MNQEDNYRAANIQMSFANKTFVVTGANSGMGYDTARYLATEGAKVYITGRNAEAVKKAAADLGPNVVGLVAYANSIADSVKVAEIIANNGDKLDGLYVNAGISLLAPVESVTEELFDRVFNTNVKGAYFTIQKLLPVLKDGSSIVINGSNSSHVGIATSSVYAASKAALNSFAKTLSRDLLPRRIRVNVVNPGLTETPLITKIGLPAEVIDGLKVQLAGLCPLNRLGTCEEITGYVAFLLSEKSSFILGTELTIDGGATQL